VSPPHLVLLVGGSLVLTTPWRSAWAAPGVGAFPGFRAFLPVLLSATATAMSAAFFLIYLSPFTPNVPAGRAAVLAGQRGIAAILVTTGVLLVPLLLLMRRWRPPPGTATVLFATVATLSGAVFEFEQGLPVLAGLIGGLVTDVLLWRLRPWAQRPRAVRVTAAAVPVALWLPYFALVALGYGLDWSLELWSGTVVLATLAGLALGLLAAPPSVPAVATGEPTVREPTEPTLREPTEPASRPAPVQAGR